MVEDIEIFQHGYQDIFVKVGYNDLNLMTVSPPVVLSLRALNLFRMCLLEFMPHQRPWFRLNLLLVSFQ